MLRGRKHILAAALAALAAGPAHAAEYGLSLYQLGLVLPAPGYTPPPGLYFWDTFFLYHGSGDLHENTRRKDNARVTYQFAGDIAVFAWYTDAEFLGGKLGVATTNAYGSDTTTVQSWHTDRSAASKFFKEQTVASFADSELTAILGWQAGEHHFKLTASGFFPTGNYDADRIAQTGLNRPALDVKGAYTFLGATGLEASAALGFTFNAVNKATDYQSGAELHLEWAIGEFLPHGFYLGVGGYFYQQITPDSGVGAIYGPFQGRVAAIGPIASYKLKAGAQQATFSARWMHEFGAYNRVRGDTIFATLGFPLWTPPHD